MTIVGKSRFGQTAAQRRAQAAVNKKFLKKTTKRGAYSTDRKKAINTRMRPMVETKNWKDSDLALIVGMATPGDPYGLYPDPRNKQAIDYSMGNISPMCNNFGFNGLDGSTFIGDNRYARMLQQKVQISFPQGENIPLVPQEAWLIHGWVTEPLNVSTITSGAIQPSAVTPAFLTQYLTEQVKEYFNERNDVLDWVPKGRSNIKVLGKKLIRPRSNTRAWTTAANSLGAGVSGYPADAQVISDSPLYVLNWNFHRKQQMYEGPPGPGSSQPSTPSPLHFERGGWIPFSVIYQPKFEDQYDATPSRLQVRSDSKFYYSDS